jgi:hypothetical protein
MLSILCKITIKKKGIRIDNHSYQRNDDFAVGMSLEYDIRSDALTKGDVIVNLAVNSQDNFPIIANQRLGATVWIDLQL